MQTGFLRRMGRIFGSGAGTPVVFCPVDDSLLAGPYDGLLEMHTLLEAIVRAEPSAVIAFKGTLQRYAATLVRTATILNVTASVVGARHVEKALVHDVEEAIYLDAQAVAGHLNLFSEWENQQLSMLGNLTRNAEKLGLPVLIIAYPRRGGVIKDDNFEDLKKEDPEKYANLVAHAVRVAVELGANIIKTQYTGRSDLFERVVAAGCGVPIVVAGGPKMDREAALLLGSEAVRAGAAGISFGRNVFNRKEPHAFIAEAKRRLVLAKHG